MHRLALIAVVLLSACTTALWAPDYKHEHVNGFYVNRDTGQLFVTTADTAYIFAIDREFGEALLLSREVDFYSDFDDFRVDKENRITGKVSLTLFRHGLADELIARLKALGFNKDEGARMFTLTREIKGRRYTIEGELPLEKLEKELTVFVAQPRTFSETAGKIIATPVAVTWDAYVTVPAVFLMVAIMATDNL